MEPHNRAQSITIKCTPALARAPSSYQNIHGALYNRLGEDNDVEVRPKFKIGDRVRILKKKTFEKCFTPIWTDELFIVNGVRLTKPVT